MSATLKDKEKLIDIAMDKELSIMHVPEYLQTCMAAKKPVCMWSSPGMGKSQVIKELTEIMKVMFWDIRAVLLDAVDLRGIPFVDQTADPPVTRWAPPGFLPRKGEVGIMNIDEINRAVVMVQNGLFQLIHDRAIGEYVLPDGVFMVAACNRETDGGGVYRMPQGLANRFIHVEVTNDIIAWTRWANLHDVATEVISFLRSRPELLHKFHLTDRAFPSPRTWEYTSEITKALANGQGNMEHALKLFTGCVGQGAGHEYHAHWQMTAKLPDPDYIRMNPGTAPVPKKPDELYAVCAAISRFMTPKNMDAFCEYLERCPEENNVCTIRDASTRDPQITNTTAFIKWSDKHGEVLGY